MTMFAPDTPNIDEKLREIEDNDLRNFMKEQGYSYREIETAIRNNHLQDEINRLEEILCDLEEIQDILLETGWLQEEIDAAFEHRNNKTN